MSHQKLSTQALFALKDALAVIYWKKVEIRKYIEFTIENPSIVSTIDWLGNPKYESVSQLIDRMAARQDIYYNDILKLFQETSNFNDYNHLKYWDEKGELTKKAKEAVERLRNQTKGHFEIIEEVKKTEERRIINQAKVRQTLSFVQKLDDCRQFFFYDCWK